MSQYIYTVEEIRELEHKASQTYEVSGDEMMQRAGKAAFDILIAKWPKAKHIIVCCGGGNNGGDGYVVAQLAHQAGMKVDLYHIGALDKLRNEALHAQQSCKKIPIHPYDKTLSMHADVIVDAICGIGLQGAPKGDALEAIDRINQSGAPVLSIDTPSGLNCQTGFAEGGVIKANETITFIGLKIGLLTGHGTDVAGHVTCCDLDLPHALYKSENHIAETIDFKKMIQQIPPRAKDAHKGNFGHVLVIGAEHGYAGAARMASEAALRTGAGLVSVAARADNANLLSLARPEMMSHAVESAEELMPLLKKATVIVIGPGLGTSARAKLLLDTILNTNLPKVIDADALNLLAEHPQKQSQWILTPHMGEAARLLKCSTDDIQKNRFDAITQLQKRYGGTVVLKGAGSLVLSDSALCGFCTDGNPGMATGGMGDVLSGVIGGLLAQGLSLDTAAKLGVSLHAKAGDMAAQKGPVGMLATDLMPHLKTLINQHA